MEQGETVTKSSNEILTELFGAFNAEPPKIKAKRTSGNDTTESKRSKKSKKNKKSKKKKHKSKKHKRKRDEEGGDAEKKKRKKQKKRGGSPSSPKSVRSVNIELPVNKVPMALEIMLDGTVGIKGEDGTMTKIPDVCEEGKNESESEVGGDVVSEQGSEEKGKSGCEGQGESQETKMPEMFEAPGKTSSEKQKKGKIQIKDLKFSTVFHETVKAVEEQKKKEEEKKASYEEGELSDSSEDENDKSEGNDKLKCRSSKEHSRHGSRTYSRDHHRGQDSEHSGKRRRSRSRSDSYHRSHRRHHSRDRSSRKRHRSGSRDYYSRDGYRRRLPSIERSHHSSGRSRDSHGSRSRSRRSRSIDRRKSRCSRASKSKEDRFSKDRSNSVEKIDKEKLLAIARKNALKLIGAGVVPGGERLTTIKAGGKTVNELTEYCKRLSEKEALGDNVSDIESESSEDEEKPFHHPFQVKDRPSSIIMNIKNAIPLPVKSLQEKAAEQAKQLRLQFPVSSGSSHRRTESEWIPVSPPKKEEPVAVKTIPVPPKPPEQAPLPPPPQPLAPVYLSEVPPPEIGNKPVFPVIQPNPPVPNLDISSIVTKRLEAIRKLQENPNDPQALTQIYSAQQEMQYWAELKQETGAFTGSTGAKVLTPSELSSGAHAWAKRYQLKKATPVKGGMGMALLQKMGWQPGEGLGKNKEGTLEPLKLEIKTDKKGLVAPNEFKKGKKAGAVKMPKVQPGPPLPTVKTLDGKHPVSLLNELCSKRRYALPQFELCFECGPDHKKNFLFKVKVNGVQYTPHVASPNKKQAKAEAAAICLRAMGIIPDTTLS